MTVSSSSATYLLTMPIPRATDPVSTELFHAYEREEIAFFTPSTIVQMLTSETKQMKQGQARQNAEKESYLRDYFAQIPQLQRGDVCYNNSGVILTEDVIVGYFDEVVGAMGDRRDVLHIVLKWSGGTGGDAGWVLPGKRDRAYENPHPDISIQDANVSLVEKEIGVSPDQIAYHFVLGYFDDRIREERFRSSGVVSFVLLDRKPGFIPNDKIGVPLNALKLLAERRVQLPRAPHDRQVYPMARNHDSLLLQVFKTARFFHTMEKVKIAQANWRTLLIENPRAARPSLPVIEPRQECPVCMELFVDAKIVCAEGHSVCGTCVPGSGDACPSCRSPALARPIRNIDLDAVCQSLHPDEYQRRYKEMHKGEAPKTWEDHPAFCGEAIIYRG